MLRREGRFVSENGTLADGSLLFDLHLIVLFVRLDHVDVDEIFIALHLVPER